ncbi:DMT family transporter [Microbacterium halophytorum]|uniref:DMT family transporter n=1 Tax=Microbacterium halophytorum TaxID=2067568 RepID=UPI000CFCE8A2|nr:multidrug efflux SMR transporter [Microbacterium halophytorum]
MTWVWLLLSIVFEVAGTLSLRASDGLRRRRWIAPIIAGYALAFAFLGLTLASGMPVGVAYGTWAAVGIVLVATAARAIWKDPLTKRMLRGMGLIIAGVLLVELGAAH